MSATSRTMAATLAAAGMVVPTTTATARDYAPSTIVSVLVDLSRTWHNPQSTGYNQQLLGSVGAAIADASPSLAKPVAVRHHVIGTASLARPPACSVTFRPSLLGLGSRQTGVESNPRTFRRYLTDSCPTFILHQRYEPTTEITAAVLSALQANAMSVGTVQRIMIILSDFKEESAVRYRLPRSALRGTRIIMLWRTLPEDRRSPGALTARISRFKRFMLEHGAASASAYADTAVAGSPADLERLIAG